MILPEGYPFVYTGYITKVIDGDTIDVELDLGFHITISRRIRMLGYDAPERHSPEGKSITQLFRDLYEGKPIICYTKKQGKYGRWLGEIFTRDGVSINELMKVKVNGGKLN